MTDEAVTAANVRKGGDAVVVNGQAGVALTAGQVVYQEAATGKYKLADSNHATAEVRIPKGIALHAAGVDQPIAIQTGGDITIGGTLSPGVAYYLSETAGGIQPAADLGSGEKVGFLGLAKSTTVLNLRIMNPGVQL